MAKTFEYEVSMGWPAVCDVCGQELHVGKPAVETMVPMSSQPGDGSPGGDNPLQMALTL